MNKVEAKLGLYIEVKYTNVVCTLYNILIRGY